jgi:hypothetical protein
LNAVCNIAVYADADADAYVGSNGIHHIGPIPTGEGVYWSRISNQIFYVMNVIRCSYPLTTTFSSFWVGGGSSSDYNYWNLPSKLK